MDLETVKGISKIQVESQWEFIIILFVLHCTNYCFSCKINWQNRFMRNKGNKCKVSIDGTDCPINEAQPFNPNYFSHKFHGPGVKYEVGICIITGGIVWFHRPFPAGYPDVRISRIGICNYLEKKEMILADGGYHDGRIHHDTTF
jgi:hypothetical protein